MPEFRRPHHQLVARVLHIMNAPLLSEAECYFGGGTHLAMTFGEYRESRDIDFLCSSRTGFRVLREQITDKSLGKILRSPIALARDVRADRDGIRTFFAIDDHHLKFEIALEGRIDLSGELDPALSVPALRIEHAIAEKLLANTDRGLDDSTLSRDLIDLAFVATRVGKPLFRQAVGIAEEVYGNAVRRSLGLVLDAFQRDRGRAGACIRSLAVDDPATLRKGLRRLRAWVKQFSSTADA